jgi:intracellular sulfur oxidation DsrE/DsrF family protein
MPSARNPVPEPKQGMILFCNRRRLLSVSLAAVAGIIAMAGISWAASGEQSRQMNLHRVALHLNSDDEKVQKAVLNNIKNLYEEYGADRLKLELIVHGPGLKLLTKKDTKFIDELAQYKKAYGVEYTACSNTMKTMKLTRDDLIDSVDRTVPALVRLIELQEAGWSYIKP